MVWVRRASRRRGRGDYATGNASQAATKGQEERAGDRVLRLVPYKAGTRRAADREISTALSKRGDVREAYASIGVHDARYVVLDNGTRLLITISYDLDFDPYFDDAIAALVGGDLSQILSLDRTSRGNARRRLRRHVLGGVQEFPGDEPDGSGHLREYRQRVRARDPKALRVQQAFQQVLDDPEAAQALQHPALKPLLDEAAD